jgi:dTDP-4-dehydrorhamnose 3,5-epimerase
MMDVIDTALPEVKLITPRRFGDERGFFSETYNRRAFAEIGVSADFVQDNHAYSAESGTLRGLHFQAAPSTQAKLVRVLRGAILDVVVDIRHGSPHFGKHIMVELTAESGQQILCPRGFAHGLVTLTPNTEVAYKVDAYYAHELDYGICFDDPDLAIDWPFEKTKLILSEKDRKHPPLRTLPPMFRYREPEMPEEKAA